MMKQGKIPDMSCEMYLDTERESIVNVYEGALCSYEWLM